MHVQPCCPPVLALQLLCCCMRCWRLAGEYYSIDVTKPPFSVTPRPLEVVDEKTADGKFMLLYEVAAMSWSDPLLGLV